MPKYKPMDKYQVMLRTKGPRTGKQDRIGITYSPYTEICMVGGRVRLLNQISNISFKFMKFGEDSIEDESGTRQSDRFRYYHKMTDFQFREGLRRLEYRYKVLPTSSVVSFT